MKIRTGKEKNPSILYLTLYKERLLCIKNDKEQER